MSTAAKKEVTAEQVKEALPEALPKKGATAEQKEAYYKTISDVGMTLLKYFFAEKHHDNLTARRPFSGLQKTTYYEDAQKVKKLLFTKEGGFKNRMAEVGHGIQLASQEIWANKTSIPNWDTLTTEEKFALIGRKNDDTKKGVLLQYLSLPSDKRTVKNLKGAMTRAGKKQTAKAEAENEKSAKPEALHVVAKAKPVIGKKEIEALIRQADSLAKELTNIKIFFDKAIEKVKEAHSRLSQELTVYKRLMDRGE